MRTILVCAIVLGMVRLAQAFPDPNAWSDTYKGAHNLLGTGGKRDRGLHCGHCHTQSGGVTQGAIDLVLSTVPAFGTKAGSPAYTPGQAYVVTITMTGEHLGPMGDNNNGVAVTFEDSVSGQTVGALSDDATPTHHTTAACSAAVPTGVTGGTTLLWGDCHAMLSQRPASGALTAWTFTWTAPTSGPVTIFFSGIDGDHASHGSLGDDVKVKNLKLVQGP